MTWAETPTAFFNFFQRPLQNNLHAPRQTFVDVFCVQGDQISFPNHSKHGLLVRLRSSESTVDYIFILSLGDLFALFSDWNLLFNFEICLCLPNGRTALSSHWECWLIRLLEMPDPRMHKCVACLV